MRLNTLNVCIGHWPFPPAFERHVDLMLAPHPLPGSCRTEVVPDDWLGRHGHALSEYSQLLWLHQNFDAVVGALAFVRLFQYRRFCAASVRAGTRSSNQPWCWVIRDAEIAAFEADFSRTSDSELFNGVFRFDGGMLAQFASAHVLEDILAFGAFLATEGILPRPEVAVFLRRDIMVPSPNIGVYRADHLKEVLGIVSRAAAFRDSPRYVARSGPQRRNLGFMMERLVNHLVQENVARGRFDNRFGHNMVIADRLDVGVSDYEPPPEQLRAD